MFSFFALRALEAEIYRDKVKISKFSFKILHHLPSMRSILSVCGFDDRARQLSGGMSVRALLLSFYLALQSVVWPSLPVGSAVNSIYLSRVR